MLLRPQDERRFDFLDVFLFVLNMDFIEAFPKPSGSNNKILEHPQGSQSFNILFARSTSVRFLYRSCFAGSSGGCDSFPRLLGSIIGIRPWLLIKLSITEES
jgi:hypothetical protein